MLYCASSNPRLPFIHVLVYRSLTVAAPNRGREKNAVRRRKRLRHHRQVVCMQRWGRRFRLPTLLLDGYFSSYEGAVFRKAGESHCPTLLVAAPCGARCCFSLSISFCFSACLAGRALTSLSRSK